MFPVEFIYSFTELSPCLVKRYQIECVIEPKRLGRSNYYTLQDIIVFKLIAILRRESITTQNISRAIECLAALKPGASLASLILYHDGKHIVDMTTSPPYNASRFGQTIMPDVMEEQLKLVAVGSELEGTRKNVNRAVDEIGTRKRQASKAKQGLTAKQAFDELVG